jgi:hypothetical protein
MLEIKRLYGKLKDKRAFCIELSKEVETSAMSIYNNWFGPFWAIPNKHIDLVLEKLKEKENN